jgi:apolipoprotein N-acyltransferase
MAASKQAIDNVVLPVRTPMLLGIDRWHYTNSGNQRFNTALFVDRDGTLLGNYAKSHLVMFGEYVPFAKRFPFLYKLTPLGAGSEAGTSATAVNVNGVCYCPSICFETTLARVMRRLVNEAKAKADGCDPQVLVNLTNDGWFWGSAELDIHLICGVFRAVECRKPLLVAANTGFSAWISSNGQIVKQAKRRAEDVIIAKPQIDHRHSFYLSYGDIFAIPSFLVVLAASMAGTSQLFLQRRPPTARP